MELEADTQRLLVDLARSESSRFRREFLGEVNSDAFRFIVRKFQLFGEQFNYNQFIGALQARPYYIERNPPLAGEMEGVLADLRTLGRQADFYKEFRRYITSEEVLGPVDERGRRV
jgi:hypothetical protein